MKFPNISVIFLWLIIIIAISLRFYHLGSVPSSLYSDEVSQGYNAYSILKTGRDEHGIFLPVSLRSFGDWKPPLPAYLMIPAIYIFGLNEASVRLPSALLGTATVYLAYLLVKLLLRIVKGREKISLISAFILTVSPWHILQSRSAMLVMVALFFVLLGIYLFLKGNDKQKYYYLGTVSLALSVYAYYGMRVIVPLLGVLLIIFTRLIRRLKVVTVSFFIALFVLLPLLFNFSKNPDVIFGRAKTVSVFHDQGTDLRLWELISQDGSGTETFVARFFHNRPYLYFRKIAANYLSHIDVRYLLLSGDRSQPFNIPGMGILYLPEYILLLLGITYMIKNKIHSGYFLLVLAFLSVIPASLTFMIPSSNRTFTAVFPYSVFIASALFWMVKNKRLLYLTAIPLVILYVANIAYFMNMYFLNLPLNYGNFWNYGWKEAVETVNTSGQKSEFVFISADNGMPYIYFLFYNKYDPQRFQNEAIRNYASDRFGFENVDSFDRFIFPVEFDWRQVKENPRKNSIYIVPVSDLPENEKSGEEIKYKNGKTALRVFQYD